MSTTIKTKEIERIDSIIYLIKKIREYKKLHEEYKSIEMFHVSLLNQLEVTDDEYDKADSAIFFKC